MKYFYIYNFKVFVTCKNFDETVKDFAASYEKILTIFEAPEVPSTSYKLNPPVVGRHVIFQKHLTSTEYLGFTEIKVLV